MISCDKIRNIIVLRGGNYGEHKANSYRSNQRSDAGNAGSSHSAVDPDESSAGDLAAIPGRGVPGGFRSHSFFIGGPVRSAAYGRKYGEALAKTGNLWFILLFGLVLGFAVAIAEPNVRILAAQIDFVSAGAIPTNLLIYCIALGVAFSVGLAMLRLVLRIPITRLLAVGFGLIFLLALIAPAQYFPVSFDAGGLTTGPLVIPFILSLGVGVASVLRGGDAAAEGFGLVGLVYIGPVLAVLLLGEIYG